MHRQKRKMTVSKRMIHILGSTMLIAGCLILYAVFQITTGTETGYISKEADSVMEFLKSSCQKYDDYQLGNQVGDLQNLQLKAENLRRYLDGITLNSADQLVKFETDQSLTGIYLLDKDLNTEYHADSEEKDRDGLLEQILSEDNAGNVQKYPQKSYAEQVTIGDISYDYVIIAREDSEGVIICYEDVTADDEDMSEFSLNSLLSGDSFRNNAVIVITDGEQVLCSNAKDLNGLPIDQCPVTDMEEDEVQVSDQGLFQLSSDGHDWYGKHSLYREYYLYVFYKDSDVFTPQVGYDIYTGIICTRVSDDHYFAAVY